MSIENYENKSGQQPEDEKVEHKMETKEGEKAHGFETPDWFEKKSDDDGA